MFRIVWTAILFHVITTSQQEVIVRKPTNESSWSCEVELTNPIFMVDCNIDSLDPSYIPEDLPVTTLNMSRNARFDFPPDGSPFLVQRNLQNYHCEHCAVTVIHEGTLSRLPKLKLLNLRSNRVHTIAATAFNRNQIKTLYVSDNRIETPRRIETMQHLATLDASGNGGFALHELEIDFSRLEKITCRGCGLEVLVGEWFARVVHLKKLELGRNLIKEVPKSCFRRNYKLVYLNLDGNPIRFLSIESSSLRELSCVGCNLLAINSQSFANVPLLESLQLRENNIAEVDAKAFALNSALERLILDDNNLTSISEDILGQRFDVFCLDGNPFQPSDEFTRFKNLYKALRLRENCSDVIDQLSSFELVIPDNLPAGVILSPKTLPPCNPLVNISHSNAVFIFPAAYGNCSHLATLEMDGNRNYSFPANAPFLHSPTLLSYSCVRCGIRTLYDQTFSRLPSLQRLNLRHNHLHKLSSIEPFAPLPNLSHLTLDHNNLQHLIIQALSTQTSLTSIQLSHNPSLEFNPNLPLFEQPSTQVFQATHCKLTQITQFSFALMPELTEINVAHNPISHLHQNAFERTRHVRILRIEHAHLHVFPAEVLNHLPEIQLIHLFGVEEHYAFEDSRHHCNNRKLLESLVDRRLNSTHEAEFLGLLRDSVEESVQCDASGSGSTFGLGLIYGLFSLLSRLC